MLGAALFLAAPGCITAPVQDTGAAVAPSVRAPALNHVYVVVDAPTFAALRDSPALAAILGRTDGGLPDYAPPAADADRIFFRGRQTYLEIFAPENRFGEPVGKVGLGLGYDAPADLGALETTWRDHCGDDARRTTVTYRRTQPNTPWYDALQCDDTAGGADLAVWVMAFRPEFHRWQTGVSDGSPTTARADVLAPRAADGQGRFDITDLSLSLPPELIGKLSPQLQRAGFVRLDDGSEVVLQGDGITLRLLPTQGASGMRSIGLSLAAPASAAVTLGGAALQADGPQRARLSFPAPEMTS